MIAATRVHMPFVRHDGGRAAAGFRGRTGDCVVRAVAIATEQPYLHVYTDLSNGTRTERKRKHERKASRSVRNGVDTRRVWFKQYMAARGWEWVPTMQIGQGCRVHLCANELPAGRLIVAVSRHYTAVIDGVIHDTHDPQRRTYHYDDQGRTTHISERCVYGYWRRQP